jgi:hypothetical protein
LSAPDDAGASRHMASAQPPPPPTSWQPGVAPPPPTDWRPGTATAYPAHTGSAWQRMSGGDKALIIFGWAGALLFWPLGVLLGFIVLARGYSKAHAGFILGVSFLGLLLGAAAMSNGAGGWLVDL